MAAKKKSNEAESDNLAPALDDQGVESGSRKKEKKKKKDKSEKRSGNFGKIVKIILLLALIGGLVAVLVYNLFDIREKYLRGIIDKIPVVSNLLPAPEESEESVGSLNGLKTEELVAKITSHEQTITDKDATIDDLNKRIDLYVAEITRLQDIEEQHEQYKQDKDEFDRLIVEGSPEAYVKFFESIDPDNADILYKEAVGTVQSSAELKKYVNTVSAMDESAAAKMLANLVDTDMDLVVMILKNINNDQSAAILGAMSADQSAAVIKRMAPTQQ